MFFKYMSNFELFTTYLFSAFPEGSQMAGDRGSRVSQHPVYRTLMRQANVSAASGYRNIGGCLLNQLKATLHPTAGIKIYQHRAWMQTEGWQGICL